MMLDQKKTGMLIIVFSTAIFMAVLLESIAFQAVNTIIHQGCNLPEGICPANILLPAESYIPLTLSALLGIFGLYTVRSTGEKPIRAKPAPSDLDNEEKKVYSLITDNGAMLQSDMINKSGITKVRMTRILDKLEAKQLIERQRRGMTNLVKVKID